MCGSRQPCLNFVAGLGKDVLSNKPEFGMVGSCFARTRVFSILPRGIATVDSENTNYPRLLKEFLEKLCIYDRTNIHGSDVIT